MSFNNNDNNYSGGRQSGQTGGDTTSRYVEGDVQQQNRGVADVDINPQQQQPGYGNTDNSGNPTDNSTYGAGGDYAYGGASTGDNDTGNVSREPAYDNSVSGGGGGGIDDTEYQQRSSKPSMTDTIRGNLEKVAGKVTRNPELQERGQDRKTGQF